MSKEINAPSAAPGIAIAPVYHHRNLGEFIPTTRIPQSGIRAECERFESACLRASDALRALKEKLEPKTDDSAAGITGIYDAHIALMTDPNIRRDVIALIEKEAINAEVALQRVVARYENVFRSIDNPTVRERAADVRDVGRQVLNVLLQREQEAMEAEDQDCVLAVDEFLPSDVGLVETRHVRGIVMGEGGKYSHGAILARSLGIPCLVGLGDNLLKLPSGGLVILDGDRGRLIVDPSAGRLQRYQERMAEREEAERRIFEVRLSPSVTRDGTAVQLFANIEGLRELKSLEEGTFDGVGLFRTEFAFMERLVFPSEDEQFKLYKEVVDAMGGRRVTFRTLDVGGDKPLAYFRTPHERNPVLGWRGIRLTLHWRDLFYTQLRALVRASASGPVSILLPMVTTIDEVRSARRILEEVRADLEDQGAPVGEGLRFGLMVEVPALATILPHVLADVDFISIGSNDLAQYLLAVDRDNPRVAGMYDPYHPGVLRFLAACVRDAHAADVPCSICGEIAGESDFIPLLLGMGYRQLSMTPIFLPRVKLTVRSVEMQQCEDLWREVSELGTAEQVGEFLREAGRKNGTDKLAKR